MVGFVFLNGKKNSSRKVLRLVNFLKLDGGFGWYFEFMEWSWDGVLSMWGFV